jgi:hypothetical protein
VVFKDNIQNDLAQIEQKILEYGTGNMAGKND